MAIMVVCRDASNAPTLRKQFLADHFSYIETILDELLIAGPNRSTPAPDAQIDSSTFIYATDDIERAKALFSKDPYAANGVYKEVSYLHFLPAAGLWIGGKSW